MYKYASSEDVLRASSTDHLELLAASAPPLEYLGEGAERFSG